MTDDKTTETTDEAQTEAPAGTEETTDATTASAPTEGQEPTDAGTEAPAEPEGDTFPRAYVEELRKESAGYRTQVRELQERLHRMSVEQTGSLADPADLPFDAAHLESPEALAAAIEELLAAKPHLKARRFAPDAAAQGAKSGTSGSVDLAGLMRAATM